MSSPAVTTPACATSIHMTVASTRASGMAKTSTSPSGIVRATARYSPRSPTWTVRGVPSAGRRVSAVTSPAGTVTGAWSPCLDAVTCPPAIRTAMRVRRPAGRQPRVGCPGRATVAGRRGDRRSLLPAGLLAAELIVDLGDQEVPQRHRGEAADDRCSPAASSATTETTRRRRSDQPASRPRSRPARSLRGLEDIAGAAQRVDHRRRGRRRSSCAGTRCTARPRWPGRRSRSSRPGRGSAPCSSTRRGLRIR